MRVVGNAQWKAFAASPQEALERGVRLDAMTRLPDIPDFQARGVYRGSHAFFEAMDAEKERRRQAWFLQHAERPD
jgi:hypothetical protein